MRTPAILLALTLASSSALAAVPAEIDQALKLGAMLELPGLVANAPALTAAERSALHAIARASLLDGSAAPALEAAIDDATLPRPLQAASASSLWTLRAHAQDWRGALAASRAELTRTDGDERRGVERSAAIATLLVDAPPMKATLPDAPFAVPTFLDLAKLHRANVALGNASTAAVLDTGANFSCIMRSVAEAAGLRIGDATAEVDAIGGPVKVHVAVAPSLALGAATFTNVPFLVFEDADLTFANGAYSIPAIVGLPVLKALQRIEITKDELRVTTPASSPAATPNLAFAGLMPMVELGIGATQHAMKLDTGANGTMLPASALAPLAAQTKHGGVTKVAREGGAGGGVKSSAAQRFEKAVLSLAGTNVTVGPVQVSLDKDKPGNLGVDVLNALPAVALDFRNLRIEALPH